MYIVDGVRYPTVTNESILGFFQEYRFLSNFYLCQTFEYLGQHFNNTEAAYMASKTHDKKVHAIFAKLTPQEARNLGQVIQLRSDWGKVKFEKMYEVNVLKYRDPVLRKLLLETDDKYLEETNNWSDRVWGVCNEVGENKLGITLMKIRSRIKDSVNFI